VKLVYFLNNKRGDPVNPFFDIKTIAFLPYNLKLNIHFVESRKINRNQSLEIFSIPLIRINESLDPEYYILILLEFMQII